MIKNIIEIIKLEQVELVFFSFPVFSLSFYFQHILPQNEAFLTAPEKIATSRLEVN